MQNGICKARSIETGYKCKMGSDGKECSKQQIVCSDNLNNCNQYGENCVKIKVSSEGISFNQCQIVTVDSKCEIDNNGNCKGKTSGRTRSIWEMLI